MVRDRSFRLAVGPATAILLGACGHVDSVAPTPPLALSPLPTATAPLPTVAPPADAPPPISSASPASSAAVPLQIHNACKEVDLKRLLPPYAPMVVVGRDPQAPDARRVQLGHSTTTEAPRSEGERVTVWVLDDHGRPRAHIDVGPETSAVDIGCRGTLKPR